MFFAAVFFHKTMAAESLDLFDLERIKKIREEDITLPPHAQTRGSQGCIDRGNTAMARDLLVEIKKRDKEVDEFDAVTEAVIRKEGQENAADRLKELDKEIEQLARSNEVTRRLQQLRGVGPLVATALVATVGDGRQYRKGRQMASALGLTPRQNSSGDKYRLFGISKRGDVYLRTQMIHGARAVVSQARHRDDPLSRWVTDIAKRRHPNVAAVALANKTARMAWAMLRNDTNYDPSLATG